MNRTIWTLWLISFVLLFCLISISLMANEEDQFKNRVNLSLRQVGHYLMLEQCDSTSTIAPVEYDGSFGFLLRLEATINYDSIPALIQQAFADYDILEPFELIVKDCYTDVPILGYNLAALYRGDIPCQGREQEVGCSNIFVQFSKKDDSNNQQMMVPAWLLIPIAAGFGFLFLKKIDLRPIKNKPDEQITMGQYYFDPKNQVLVNGSEKMSLTFRENKLLHLFAIQPNEVLTRAEILSAIWEDEGVIVGRSLDVFISRLRKLLRQDPNVQIKNVHGVGYRLELP